MLSEAEILKAMYAETHYCQTNAPSFCLGCVRCCRGFVSRPKCACGKLAAWHAAGLSDHWAWYCEDCIEFARGCSCQVDPETGKRFLDRQGRLAVCADFDEVKPLRLGNKWRKRARKIRTLKRAVKVRWFGSGSL